MTLMSSERDRLVYSHRCHLCKEMRTPGEYLENSNTGCMKKVCNHCCEKREARERTKREEREREQRAVEERERPTDDETQRENRMERNRRALQNQTELHDARLLYSHNNVSYAYGPKET